MSRLHVGLRQGRILTTIDLRAHERLTIGRSPRCELRLPAPNVSRRHALLFRCGHGWHITDTASRRGIRSDRGWVRHLALSSGRTASIGPVDLWIEEDGDGIVAPFELPRNDPIDPLTPDPAMSGPVLVVMDAADGASRRFPLEGLDLLTVGRGGGCDVRLFDPSISRLHCVLYTEHRGWYVADAGSVAGTRVDGRRTLRRRVRDDLLVQIGGCRLWVEGNHRFVDHSADTMIASVLLPLDASMAASLDEKLDSGPPLVRTKRKRSFRRGLPSGVGH